MSTDSMDTGTTENAIQMATLAINSLDGSRRVAWAKMYAALRRGNEAERELATKREDIILLNRFGGFSYGVFEALGIKEIYKTYIPNGDLGSISSYFEQGAVNAGRDIGHNWREQFPEAMQALFCGLEKKRACLENKLDAIKEQLAELRRERAQLRDDLEGCRVQSKRAVRKDLMEQFDIPTDTEFFRWLARYSTDAA